MFLRHRFDADVDRQTIKPAGIKLQSQLRVSVNDVLMLLNCTINSAAD